MLCHPLQENSSPPPLQTKQHQTVVPSSLCQPSHATTASQSHTAGNTRHTMEQQQQQQQHGVSQCPYCHQPTLPDSKDQEVSEDTDEARSNDDEAGGKHTNGDMTVLCPNNECLHSLIHSWDVETFLEEPDHMVCKYFKKEGRCPYQEVGCMFKHEKEEESDDEEVSNDEEIEQRKEEPIRHSARSRNRKINEESFKRLRDLSISC